MAVDLYGDDQCLAYPHTLYDLRYGCLFRHGAKKLETVFERQNGTDTHTVHFWSVLHLSHQCLLRYATFR